VEGIVERKKQIQKMKKKTMTQSRKKIKIKIQSKQCPIKRKMIQN